MSASKREQSRCWLLSPLAFWMLFLWLWVPQDESYSSISALVVVVGAEETKDDESASSSSSCPTVCADGTALSQDVLSLAIETPLSPVKTCGELQDLLHKKKSVNCRVVQTIGFLYCQCATPPSPQEGECSLCIDGSLPQGDKDLDQVFVSGTNDTGIEVELSCRSLVLSAMGATDAADCWAFQSVLGVYCGCPAIDYSSKEEAGQVCRLCGNLTADNLLPTPGSLVGDGQSCAELEYVATRALGDTDDKDAPPCVDFQETAQSLKCCEVPKDEEEEDDDDEEEVAFPDSCPVCSDGVDRSNDTDYDAFLYVSAGGVNVTCNVLRGFMETLGVADVDNGYCRGWQGITSHYCGCPPPPPLSPCNLCPDGSLPPLMDNMVPLGENLTLSCRNLHLNAAQVPPSSSSSRVCFHFQQKGVLHCGCPKPPDTKCPHLCPNGDPLPHPDRQLHLGLTCGQLELLASLETMPRICRAHQTVAAPYCGCLGYHLQNENSEKVCRLCGAQVLLPDFGRWTPVPHLGDAARAHCGIAEISATAGNDHQCALIRETSHQSCCVSSGRLNATQNNHTTLDDDDQVMREVTHDFSLVLCVVPRREMTLEEGDVLSTSVLTVVNEFRFKDKKNNTATNDRGSNNNNNNGTFYTMAVLTRILLDTDSCKTVLEEMDNDEHVSLQVTVSLTGTTTAQSSPAESFFVLDNPTVASSLLVAELNKVTRVNFFQRVSEVRVREESPAAHTTMQPSTLAPTMAPLPSVSPTGVSPPPPPPTAIPTTTFAAPTSQSPTLTNESSPKSQQTTTSSSAASFRVSGTILLLFVVVGWWVATLVGPW